MIVPTEETEAPDGRVERTDTADSVTVADGVGTEQGEEPKPL